MLCVQTSNRFIQAPFQLEANLRWMFVAVVFDFFRAELRIATQLIPLVLFPELHVKKDLIWKIHPKLNYLKLL